MITVGSLEMSATKVVRRVTVNAAPSTVGMKPKFDLINYIGMFPFRWG